MSSSTYDVYRVETSLAMPDPMMGPGTRYHNAIFVATGLFKAGRFLQDEGAIGDRGGMIFTEKQGEDPEESDTYHQRYYVGKSLHSDYTRLVELLQAIPPPQRQRMFNPVSMTTEQCKPDGTFYSPGEPRPPYMKCTEWTLQKAIPTLQQSGLLK